MGRCLAVFVLGLVAWLPSIVHAQSCSVSAGPMSFGTTSAVPVAQADVSPSFTVTCSGGDANDTLTVCVGISPSPAGNRLMSNGANTLQYQIYTNPVRTVVWTSDSQLSPLINVTLNGSGNGNATAPMYGRLLNPPAQSPPSGIYNAGLSLAGRISKNKGCNNGSEQGSLTGGSFNVTASIGGSCTISATPINFGSTTNLAAAINATGALTATCTSGLPYTLALNAGSTTGNTIAARRMSLGGTGPGVVAYQLYRDPGPTNLWGDGSTGGVHSGSGSGSAQTLTVYGQVPVQAMPAGGTYQDTVTATISY